MNKSEARKENILKRGLEVMKSQGYNGTSVKDIVDAAGVPKGSFYNYFESKEAFAAEAIARVAAETYHAMSEMLRGSETSAQQRIQRFFQANADNSCDGNFQVGCFLGNMCQEMSDNSERIRREIHKALADVTTLLETALEQAKKQGELTSPVETHVLAEFLFNGWEGALMRMKASKCKEPLDAFNEVLNSLFKQ